ncbi:hypothetical protein C2W64_02604 [Brevibacillus laterosporus]|nr:hypothetical protein C2W64_02604 [Brevibacillus laterosporus]
MIEAHADGDVFLFLRLMARLPPLHINACIFPVPLLHSLLSAKIPALREQKQPELIRPAVFVISN